MSDTVEVVAAKELRLPTGYVEKGELFPTTAANVANLTALDMLVLADGKDDEKVERAIKAGATARKELDARFAKEAKEQADAEAAAAKAAEAAEAKAAKKAPTLEKEG